jgi:DNA-binding IclR family transcriptional regulator
MPPNESKYQAPALDKGLDILEYLSSQSVPLSQTEIAMGISRSSNEIYRMLVSLETRGYVLRDEVSGKYRLSLKLYHLSHRHSPVDELCKAAQFPIEELAASVRQSCHLSILYLDQLMVVLHVKSPEPIALSVEEGNLFPLPLTASGKVLLAYMPETERNKLLSENEHYKEFSATEKRSFLNSLEQIKTEGAYIKTSDLAEGVVDISVPVGKDSNVVASLTVSRLTTLNINKGRKNEEILKEAFLCADKIRKRIGL